MSFRPRAAALPVAPGLLLPAEARSPRKKKRMARGGESRGRRGGAANGAPPCYCSTWRQRSNGRRHRWRIGAAALGGCSASVVTRGRRAASSAGAGIQDGALGGLPVQGAWAARVDCRGLTSPPTRGSGRTIPASSFPSSGPLLTVARGGGGPTSA